MRGAAPLAIVALLAASACTRPASDFSAANARAHIDHLAGAIGSRPAGTAANARARAYLVDQLSRLGFRVRVQAADAVNARHGVSGRVHNVVAVRDGARREALGLVAHYDSVPEGPGAADDGLGTAVVLEAARVLAGRADRRWSLMVLLTDAEEDGLLGASAAVEDPEIRGRLKAVVNVEAIGADAPVLLFETGPGSGWLAGVWARAVPRPRGGSFNYEIYRRMPNDTDFSVFSRAGIPGLNFAAVGDMYAYHTSLDAPARVTTRALADAGGAVVALADALDREDLLRRSEAPPTYFDIAGLVAFAWGPATDLVLAALALGLGAIAWLRVLAACWRAGRLRTVALSLAWAVAGAGAVCGASIGGIALLRAVREVHHPWYAHPGRFAVVILLAGLAAGWVLWRLAAHLPRALRLPRDAACVWLSALAAWIGLAALTAWSAPRAAYLWVLPLLAVAVPVAAAGAGRGALLAGSTLSAGVAGLLWLPDAATFFTFLVALMGTLPVVAPAAAVPAVLLLAALMVAPPLVAIAVGTDRRRPPYLTRALLVALGLSVGWAYQAPAYTGDRPMRLALISADGLATTAGGTRWLAVAGNEPVPDLGSGGPLLSPAPVLPDLERRLAAGAPFVAAGTSPALPPAGAVTCSEAPAPDGVDVLVAVTPRIEGLRARLDLPPSVLPRRSNWPGSVRDGRWSASFAAVPAEGLTFRVGLDAAGAGRGCEGRLLLRRPRADGNGGGPPRWLARPGIAWDFLVVDILPLR